MDPLYRDINKDFVTNINVNFFIIIESDVTVNFESISTHSTVRYFRTLRCSVSIFDSHFPK